MIGQKIKNKRKELNLTQEYLAKEINISRQAVSKWEKGMSEPSMENLIKLSEIFGVDIGYFKNEKERENAILIYNIFKDSDALDRWRLGLADGLDISYLRTSPAKNMIDFSKETVIKSMDGNAPKDIAELRRRFLEKRKWAIFRCENIKGRIFA